MKVNTNAPFHPSVSQEASIEKSKAKENGGKPFAPELTSAQKLPGSEVEISERAQLLKKANEIVHQTPEIRKERVEELKAQILAGTYRVDAGSIADKLLEDHLGTDFGKNNL